MEVERCMCSIPHSPSDYGFFNVATLSSNLAGRRNFSANFCFTVTLTRSSGDGDGMRGFVAFVPADRLVRPCGQHQSDSRPCLSYTPEFDTKLMRAPFSCPLPPLKYPSLERVQGMTARKKQPGTRYLLLKHPPILFPQKRPEKLAGLAPTKGRPHMGQESYGKEDGGYKADRVPSRTLKKKEACS